MIRRQRLVAATFIALVCTAVVVCPATAVADPTPCSFFTTADASKALGVAVTGTVPYHAQNAFGCSYRSAHSASLRVVIIPLASAAIAATAMHGLIASAPHASPSEPIPKLCDAAYRAGATIYVRNRSTVYTFTVISADGNGAGALRMIALARATVANL